MSLAPDGKILLFGTSAPTWHGMTSSDMAVIRLDATGPPDLSFSGDGWTIIDLGARKAEVTALQIQADGKIVAAAYDGDQDSEGFMNADVAVVQFY